MGHNDHMSEADDRRMRRQTKSNRRTPPVLLPKQPGQFGEFAMCYWDNGLKSIPAENKIPLVAGATGHEGTVTFEKVSAWMEDPVLAVAHLSLRAEGWISIDVDDYDGKQGADQLEGLERQLGVLPDTYTSTARGAFSASRQYFYRVPDDTPRKTKAAKDIEIVQRCHRNAAVHPTYHRKTGTVYQWYSPDGRKAEELPRLEDFAWLPNAWLEYLARNNSSEADCTSRGFFRGDPSPWAIWLGSEEPSEAYQHLAATIEGEKHIGHDALGSYLLEIHTLRATHEETGGIHALEALHLRYFETTNEPDPDREWDNWVRWVIGSDWQPTQTGNQNLVSQVRKLAAMWANGGTDAA